MCQITPNVWNDLGKYARLQKLANINYEILSGPFLSFLSTQSNLHFLSFTRPPDIYNISGIRSNVLDPRVDITSFTVTEAAPHLGLARNGVELMLRMPGCCSLVNPGFSTNT